MRGKKSSRVIMISAAIMVVVGMTMFFIYFSIDAAKNMDVSIYDYTVVSKDNQQTKYDTIIQFVNTSFVPLSAGDTSYNINIDGENLGTGTIKPFSPFFITSDMPPQSVDITGTPNAIDSKTALDIPSSILGRRKRSDSDTLSIASLWGSPLIKVTYSLKPRS